MVGIVLTILKVIGIILLCLIGIVLLLIGTVLFCPIHYRVKGSKEEGIQAVIDVSWMFRILRFHGYYEQGKDFEYYLKVLFFRLFPKEETSSFEKIRKSKEETLNKEESREKAKETEVKNKENKSQGEKKSFQEKDKINQENENTSEEDKVQENERQKQDKKEQDKEEQNKKQQPQSKEKQRTSSEGEKEKKPERKNIFYKIKDKIEHIKYNIRKICDKVKEIVSNYEKFKEFITSKDAKEVLKFLKQQGKYLVRHLKPDKFQVEMHFGMDDPAQTGDLLAIYSMMYPFLPGTWNVIPDFEHACFQGSLNIKGKVHLFWFLIVGWHCYKNKTIRKFIPVGK